MAKEATIMEQHENPERHDNEATVIDIFLQGEGITEIVLLKIPTSSKVGDLIEIAKEKGLPSEDATVYVVTPEGEEKVFEITATLEAEKIHHHSRIHIHRCKKITVTVNFKDLQASMHFPPAVTIHHVHHWATGEKGFNLAKIDASEHALQICDSNIRPDQDIHLGTLTKYPNCAVCFDLVPKKRVEGLI
jgi:hypothetical protein